MAGILAVGMLMSISAIGASAGTIGDGGNSHFTWNKINTSGNCSLTNTSGAPRAAQVRCEAFNSAGNSLSTAGNSTSSLSSGSKISATINKSGTALILFDGYFYAGSSFYSPLAYHYVESE